VRCPLFNLRDRQQLNHGFGDAMSRAFEIAVTPVIFGLLGFWLDHVFGTQPVLTVALAVFAVVGMFVRSWIGYDAEMRRHEAELPHNRKAARP
jgi:F0F1-type ATP synthase assembly protein I